MRKLSVGDWVEVRSKEEILNTLDSDGRVEGMPFMPEMFPFCGMKFQVFKRAHKSCDPDFRSRRIDRAVHLETRCDGDSHGGCQAGCLIFWKEVWLKPIDAPEAGSRSGSRSELIHIAPAGGCTESVVRDRAQVVDANGGCSFVCQTTQVQFETPLAWWDIRQYLEDYWSGNVSLWRLLSGTIYSAYYNLSTSRLRVGPILRWLYNAIRPISRDIAWPRTPGIIPKGQPTPTAELNLQPGELVRVRSQDEILRTVNTDNKNRGLWWDAELVPYCGRTFRVLKRVTKVLDEKTGKMQEMRTPSIILDSAVCQARYSACRMFCPRNTYAYWREIWLERVDSQVPSIDNHASQSSV